MVLDNLLKDLDNYRLETLKNVFYIYNNSNNIYVLKESVNNYKFAIDIHTKLYLLNLEIKKSFNHLYQK